jgi:hypothetical protein
MKGRSAAALLVAAVALLSCSDTTAALSSHSPQDLLAYPQFHVALEREPVSNSTAEKARVHRRHRPSAEEEEEDGAAALFDEDPTVSGAFLGFRLWNHRNVPNPCLPFR